MLKKHVVIGTGNDLTLFQQVQSCSLYYKSILFLPMPFVQVPDLYQLIQHHQIQWCIFSDRSPLKVNFYLLESLLSSFPQLCCTSSCFCERRENAREQKNRSREGEETESEGGGWRHLQAYMTQTSKAKSTESIKGQGGNSAGNKVLAWAAA